MGCINSKMCIRVPRKKKKSIAKQGTPVKAINSAHDGNGKLPKEDQSPSLKTQLEKYEWQLKLLHTVLAASGIQEREQLLQEHQNGDLCMLVHSITQKVKTETIAQLLALHEEQMRNCAEQHQKKAEEMQHLHSAERSTLEEFHMASKCALKEQIDMLTADLKMFTEIKQRVKESTLNRDLQRNIQTHGSPGAFWEQEQESLLFVIEMKKERLQKQGDKLRQMEALIEKNFALEAQVKQVLCQNEDLRVQIDNYQALVRQLSKEQSELQEAFKKQSLQGQKMTREKEELLFKLSMMKTPVAAGVNKE
uniref:Coiled-coil domain containing 69 n=1 Tax=Electrophorus electricus TaxID=8005 RepID=A0A4W4FZK8_ELEEL